MLAYIETKFLHLRQSAALEEIASMGGGYAGWGGWDKGKVLYTVMVERSPWVDRTDKALYPGQPDQSRA